MAQQTSVSSLLDMTSSSNVVFLGEAGSGKSEIALNFAQALAELGGKPVHFFDLDMTKPLFRSRDRREALEALGVEVHYEAQFMDAPTLTGGVRQRLNDPHCCAVLDVGGRLHRRPLHRGICPPAQPGRHYGVLRDQPLPPLVGHPGAH